ncbi:MAG: S1 RNA-binding domain-containing protein [Lachnospiraceae bacterium]|nr:S1 RNA-binding domain-containing protein [Lachnospiraceae bacterium]
MWELGKTAQLAVDHFTDNGAYLRHTDDLSEKPETVLLPNRYIPEGTKKGDLLEVFLYKDSEDRPIATTDRPLIEAGGLAQLKVKAVTKIGAFLDWGLPKDLFLPYKEQRGELVPGQSVFVTAYVDKSDRLCASMHVDRFFRTDPPYKEGDRVSGTVYALNPEIGAFVAVDGLYYGLIPKQELYEKLRVGDTVEARVLKKRPDGKLNLSTRKKAYAQMKTDAETVMEHLEMAGGILGLGDKSDAVLIKAELSMSKSAFKRAAGALLKAGKIRVFDDRIEKV